MLMVAVVRAALAKRLLKLNWSVISSCSGWADAQIRLGMYSPAPGSSAVAQSGADHPGRRLNANYGAGSAHAHCAGRAELWQSLGAGMIMEMRCSG